MLIFAVTIFLSAFLLFAVQPLMGKFILPWFGGGASVWTVCLLFFQGMLLIGYTYAHFLNRHLQPRAQVIVHGVLLLMCLLFLPIVPDPWWKPADSADPTWRILALMTVCIGGPYLAVSSTAPLLQAWFSRLHPGVSPYRLYALSNAGSLLALLTYPLLAEPLLARVMQAYIWSGGFAAYVLACGLCIVRVSHVKTIAADSERAGLPLPPAPAPTWHQRALWILLPGCASALLLAFTTRLSEEIAPIPLLWILPLAVYLISFIITFEWPSAYNRNLFVPLLIVSYGIVLLLMVMQTRAGIGWQIAASLTALFACCMVSHGEVYRLRPAPAHLTSFYLAIALGGALGATFVSVIAPRIFSFAFEFYLALFGVFILLMISLWRDPASAFHRGARRPAWMALTAIVLAAAFCMQRKHADIYHDTLLRTRNFYGTLRVDERPGPTPEEPMYALYHGRIIHGAQVISPRFLRAPTTYYGPTSGGGLVLQYFRDDQPRRVGVVGLGIGTLATYGRKGDVFRFYEINPAVAELARDPFGYLASSPAEVEVVLGDARLSMERESPQDYDVIVLDAFSGDSVPVHLLTAEAFAIYQKHLKPGGVILAHVSNEHLHLHLALTRMAEHLGWEARLVLNDNDRSRYVFAAEWVIITANPKLLEEPNLKAVGLKPRPAAQEIDLWTDDHANLLQLLR